MSEMKGWVGTWTKDPHYSCFKNQDKLKQFEPCLFLTSAYFCSVLVLMAVQQFQPRAHHFPANSAYLRSWLGNISLMGSYSFVKMRILPTAPVELGRAAHSGFWRKEFPPFLQQFACVKFPKPSQGLWPQIAEFKQSFRRELQSLELESVGRNTDRAVLCHASRIPAARVWFGSQHPCKEKSTAQKYSDIPLDHLQLRNLLNHRFVPLFPSEISGSCGHSVISEAQTTIFKCLNIDTEA